LQKIILGDIKFTKTWIFILSKTLKSSILPWANVSYVLGASGRCTRISKWKV